MSEGEILTFPERPEDRLRLALRRLDEALAEQHEAVSAWRGELSGLAQATARLDGSLQDFRGNLQTLASAARLVDDEVGRLGRTARAMETLGHRP